MAIQGTGVSDNRLVICQVNRVLLTTMNRKTLTRRLGRNMKFAARIIILISLVTGITSVQAQRYPEPNPPVMEPVKESKQASSTAASLVVTQAAPTTEWTIHKGNNGATPSDAEQRMLWLMNRARSNPIQEGIFLTGITDTDVTGAIDFFGVDTDAVRSQFAAIPAAPPAVFDFRMYEGSLAHSLDLIARDAQDHNNQFQRIEDAGFFCNGGRVSVFSFSESALHAHAGLNIDWGNNPPTGIQDPPGHRHAIMGVDGNNSITGFNNVGLALVEENDLVTDVGPLVFSGAYCNASSFEIVNNVLTSTPTVDHFNLFIVGTVWNDANSNDEYDEGEGLGGVTVMPDDGTYFAVTGDAGGYSIPILSAGTYNVTFSGGGLGNLLFNESVTVGSSNVLLDLESSSAAAEQDTDSDGVSDATDNCVTVANAGQTDTDGDGDGDACDSDDDNDGMSDSYENDNGLNPTDSSDAALDSDGDGLDNLTESQLGTAADDPDTDGDGVSDSDEVTNGTNPTVDEDTTSILLQIFSNDE